MRNQVVDQVSSISHKVNQPRIYSGFLAEHYDGIGQFVLVTLSKNSMTALVRARVSSGDFANGRVFPIGTPLVLFIGRGQAEILTLGAGSSWSQPS